MGWLGRVVDLGLLGRARGRLEVDIDGDDGRGGGGQSRRDAQAREGNQRVSASEGGGWTSGDEGEVRSGLEEWGG